MESIFLIHARDGLLLSKEFFIHLIKVFLGRGCLNVMILIIFLFLKTMS